MRRYTAASVLAVVAALLLVSSGGTRAVKEGGTFRVGSQGFDSIDPALAVGIFVPQLLRATCAGLLNAPDKPLPTGLRLVPEVAADYPTITRDGTTYTFTIRSGFRFSTGARVTARDFAATINRQLNPAFKDFVPQGLLEIVGARRVLEGEARAASGVIARRDKLIVRLLKPDPTFQATMAFCVLPASLPFDAEGVKAPVPGAGPYFISDYILGERAVLKRNPYYNGGRPHYVNAFRVTFGLPDELLDKVERGELDYAAVSNGATASIASQLAKKYGVNKTQFWAQPSGFVRMFVLNASGALFRKNPKLRQAVNFAVDRKALSRERGGSPGGHLTDQYLTPIKLGFRDERIYPLKGPDVRKAKQLAKGHTRSGKAVLYVSTVPPVVAQGEIIRSNLARIGLEVEVKTFPVGVLFQKLATPGEPFDIGWVGWEDTSRDPASFLRALFDGRTIGLPDNGNWSYFNSPKYNRLLDEASRLTGDERYRAFSGLDVRLSRDAAPAIPYSYDNTLTFVSARTGCVIVNPYLDLAAVCLK